MCLSIDLCVCELWFPPPTNTHTNVNLLYEDAGFMTYTASSQKVAIKKLWLIFSFFFIYISIWWSSILGLIYKWGHQSHLLPASTSPSPWILLTEKCPPCVKMGVWGLSYEADVVFKHESFVIINIKCVFVLGALHFAVLFWQTRLRGETVIAGRSNQALLQCLTSTAR